MVRKTLKEHILEALEDLRKDQLERFKSKLNVVQVKRGYRQIPWLMLEEAMPLTLAEIIVNSYREEYGARLTAQILREINEMILADRLLEALRGGCTSGKFRASAAKRPTAAKATLQRGQKRQNKVQCGAGKTRRPNTKKHKMTSSSESGSREETGKQSGGPLKEGQLDAAGTSGSAASSQMFSQAKPWAIPSHADGASGNSMLPAASSLAAAKAAPKKGQKRQNKVQCGAGKTPRPNTKKQKTTSSSESGSREETGKRSGGALKEGQLDADGASGNPIKPAANSLAAAKAAPKKRQKRQNEAQCGAKKTRRPYTKKNKTTSSRGDVLKEGQLDADGASGNPMPPAANSLAAAKAAPKKRQKHKNEAQCGDKKTRRPYTKKNKTTSSSESGSREETGRQSGGALKEGQLDAAGTSGSTASSQMFSQAVPWAMPSPAAGTSGSAASSQMFSQAIPWAIPSPAAGTSGSTAPSQMFSQAVPWARPSPSAGTSGSAAPSQMFIQAVPWARPSPAELHFVDRHRVAIIRWTNLVEPILDKLLDQNLLTQEQYDAIQSKYTSQKKMRALYKFVRGWGRADKDRLYEALKAENGCLIRDLGGQ